MLIYSTFCYFQSKCVNIHKMYLEKDSETDQLQFDISQLKSNITTLENCRDDLSLKVKDMEVDLEQLHESESRLMVDKETAMEARQSAEEQVLNLQRDLSRLQSEMTLTAQVIDMLFLECSCNNCVVIEHLQSQSINLLLQKKFTLHTFIVENYVLDWNPDRWCNG